MGETTEPTAYERLVTFTRAAHAAIEAEYERHVPGFYPESVTAGLRARFEMAAKQYADWQVDDGTERWITARALDHVWVNLKTSAELALNDPDLPKDFDRSGFDPEWSNRLLITIHQ